jgi:hypothetical protein
MFTFTDTTTAPTTPTTQIFTDPFGNKVNYTGQMKDMALVIFSNAKYLLCTQDSGIKAHEMDGVNRLGMMEALVRTVNVI